MYALLLVALISIVSQNISYSQIDQGGEDPRARPNIVFIFVDDLGWSDLSYQGSKVYETPNVDRLASEGMVFTDFYAAGPVCSPTRASLLTGKYPTRTGITTFLLDPERDPGRGIKPHLETSEVTIAEALKKHNYTTGYFGKWHLGYSKEHWAANQGFDVAIGGMDLPWAWRIAHPNKKAPDMDREKGHTRFFSPHHLTFMQNGPQGEYLTERLTNETMNFIENNQDKPFFALLSFHTVHTPLQAKPEVVEKYRKKISKMGLLGNEEKSAGSRKHQNLPEYAAMVQHMDENIGRLLAKLKELRIEENTIVVFTSDNGGKQSVTANAPLKGAKHNLDEGGIRVPTIVKWPKIIQAGSKNSTPLISNDFYPTVLDLAGLPLEPENHLDGISFKNILVGNSKSVNRDALFFHYPHSRMEGAVRWKNFKLNYRYETGECTLYDLSKDIGETKDLSKEMPGLTNDLTTLLREGLKSTDAKFPEGVSMPVIRLNVKTIKK
ncbi:MAG: sulfatase [Cyclobacteriaceae bacterium]|nr:sulfatase [Cyclobacteriaceae bacterium]